MVIQSNIMEESAKFEEGGGGGGKQESGVGSSKAPHPLYETLVVWSSTSGQLSMTEASRHGFEPPKVFASFFLIDNTGSSNRVFCDSSQWVHVHLLTIPRWTNHAQPSVMSLVSRAVTPTLAPSADGNRLLNWHLLSLIN